VEVRPSERLLLVEERPAAIGARLRPARPDRAPRPRGEQNELLDTVWPGVVVEEKQPAGVQVSTLRKLLGANSVATIPGRGYRFTLVPEDSGRASLGAAPLNNLPAALSRFIGREAEIAEVKSLLGTSRLVTLTGVGGTGKTRLSLQVAGEVLADFPDGVWFVELASLNDGRRAAQVVAFVLGVTEEAGKPVIEALVKSVKDKRLLCVLDNCEHLIEAPRTSPGACCRRGPTSRSPPRAARAAARGESAYRVPALATTQAIQLSSTGRARRAPASRPLPPMRRRWWRSAGASTASRSRSSWPPRACVPYPWSRSPRASTTSACSPAGIRPRCRPDAARFDGMELRDAPGPVRILLRRLAVFSGGWTLEAAEAVCAGGEVESASVLEVLTNLVEKSLVDLRDSAGERFQLLESVRQYALELLEGVARVAAMHAKHVDYYLALAGRARPELLGPEQAKGVDPPRPRSREPLAAHEWCARTGEGHERGLRLVATLKQYWIRRGLLGLARPDRGSARAIPRPKPRARTRVVRRGPGRLLHGPLRRRAARARGGARDRARHR
jgi:predicted ATPase